VLTLMQMTSRIRTTGKSVSSDREEASNQSCFAIIFSAGDVRKPRPVHTERPRPGDRQNDRQSKTRRQGVRASGRQRESRVSLLNTRVGVKMVGWQLYQNDII
jgi:hypothetical protein